MTSHPQRQPVSLRISVTDRCQLRCLYCMPPEGTTKLNHDDILSFEEVVRFVRLVKSEFGLLKVHVTGGEPLVRADVVDLVAMLAAEGPADLALTTNGQYLVRMAAGLKSAGLNRINVSLDSLNDKTYALLTRGGQLSRTLEGIHAALQQGFSPVKLNTVILRGHNLAEVTSMAQWAIEHGCHIRFLELMPIGCAKEIFRESFVPYRDVLALLDGPFVLEALPYAPGRSSRDFLARDSSGRRGIIGFIPAQSRPFCQGCRRMRLTSTGQLISCLARGSGPSIREILRAGDERADRMLGEILACELTRKRARVGFDTPRIMASVGG